LDPEVWNYCTGSLRDDGFRTQDYLEQLTPVFLKMAEERAEMTGQKQPIPRKKKKGPSLG